MPNRVFINRLIGAFLLAAIVLSACAPQPALPATPEPTPQPTPKPRTVAEKLVEALNVKDVEGALSLFAEDAIVHTGDPTPKTYIGTAEIREWLEELADANFKIEVENLQVDGDTVIEAETLSMDPWKEIGLTSLKGVRKIKIRDGLIQSIEFSFNETFLRFLKTALLKAAQPAYADVAYGEDSPAQMLDLYLPQTGNPPFPVILMIHGAGDEKDDHNGMAGFFNQAGFAAVLINYREKQPQMMSDALCALAWTKANADKYGLDPERVILFGYSVGGGIVATLGTLDDRSGALQDCGYPLADQGRILGVAAYEGILGTAQGCFSSSWCLDLWGIPVSEVQPVFKILSTTEPAKWKDADTIGPQAEAFARHFPLYWLDGSEPPFLVIHGDGGANSVPRIESEDFVKRLQAAGVDVQLLELDTADHYSIYPNAPSFPEIAGAVVEFAGKLGTQ